MSDAIHGVTFVDWGCANAQMTQGKTIEDLLPILGVELPQWEEINDHWLAAMAADETFAMATEYGQFFTNPAQGKFADMATSTTSDALEKIPNMAAFLDLMTLNQVASKYGVDSQAVMAERGIELMDFSQASMHYMGFMADAPPEYTGDDWHSERTRLMQVAEAKYEEQFSAQSGGAIGDDIEF